MIRKTFIHRYFNHTKRFKEIIIILTKYGLTDYIKILRLDKSFRFISKLMLLNKSLPKGTYSKWQRIRMAVEELGPTFVKLGQLLSNRTDVLPKELILELEKLQDNVPPFSEESVKKVIKRELKKSIDESFLSFSEKPIASASIAQVHKATLQNGDSVAVKIQRPDIEGVIDSDLDILAGFASLLAKYVPRTRLFDPIGIVKEFRVHLKIELNFQREMLHMQKFENIFRNMESIHIPVVYKEFSSRRVLTMEYISGVKITEVKYDTTNRFNKKLLARRMADLILEQIFIHGFFHADPHPGNIMVLDNNVICFLDFGMMGRIRPKENEFLSSMMVGMANTDAEVLTRAILDLTQRTRPINIQELEIRIYDLLEEYIDLSLEDFEIAALFNDLVRIIYNFGLQIPSNLMLMIKALIAIQGIGLDLYPYFNLVKLFKPIAKKIFARKFHPKILANEMLRSAFDYKALLQDLPVVGKEILKIIKEGRLKIGFRIGGLDPLRTTLDRITYRLVFGLVLAALLISSSLILLANLPPRWHDIPIIGLFGFAAAGLIGFSFLTSMLIKFIKKYI